MLTELVLSTFNERRLGDAGRALREGPCGRRFYGGEVARPHRAGPALARSAGPAAHHVASGLYLAGGLLFRMAWVEAGKASARDAEAIVATARG